ncbi:hypothetical protein BJ878DRAFT_155773 [Calycina marina]|uniref:Uncharacterized protein n=1 Tax=Calycina marina TaxID=1763456 RepID=A0A9P8CDL2_9HELO|nr:hypothetical protein BJ878DRAFT_155773 [Calycina marina]
MVLERSTPNDCARIAISYCIPQPLILPSFFFPFSGCLLPSFFIKFSSFAHSIIEPSFLITIKFVLMNPPCLISNLFISTLTARNARLLLVAA